MELMGVAFAALSCQHEAIGCFKRQLSMCAAVRRVAEALVANGPAPGSSQARGDGDHRGDEASVARLPPGVYWCSEVRAAAHLQVMYQDVFDREAAEASAAGGDAASGRDSDRDW